MTALGGDVGGPAPRHEPAFPNTTHVARREYLELVRSRLFHVSTITLMLLAMLVALLPIVARVAERGSTTRIAIVATDRQLANQTTTLLDTIMNRDANGAQGPLVVTLRADDRLR